MFNRVFIFLLGLYYGLISDLSNFVRSQKGVTAIEYALIAVAISSMLFIVLGSGGEDGLISRIKESFRSIQEGLSITRTQSGAK